MPVTPFLLNASLLGGISWLVTVKVVDLCTKIWGKLSYGEKLSVSIVITAFVTLISAIWGDTEAYVAVSLLFSEGHWTTAQRLGVGGWCLEGFLAWLIASGIYDWRKYVYRQEQVNWNRLIHFLTESVEAKDTQDV